MTIVIASLAGKELHLCPKMGMQSNFHIWFEPIGATLRKKWHIWGEIDDVSVALTYHDEMSLRWPFPAALALSLLLLACNKPKPPQPVVVHVFRDLYSPYAHEVDHRILDFQASNPRLPSGAPVVVQSINEGEYQTALKGTFDKDVKVEVVILNSPVDAGENPVLVSDLSHAANICAAVKACPAVVPAFIMPSATGNQAAASQVFIDFLSKKK
jgi:hypothetical protein